jgi:nitroreductase
MEAIRSRRSVRSYSDRPVEEEKLLRVLEAARLSPSATNAQNWRFILVRDKEKLRKLTAAAGLGHFFEDQVKEALGIPETVRVIVFTPIGYPAEQPEPRPRKSFGEVVGYDRY